MAELNLDAKLRLVTLLAQFSGPAEAARTVSRELGVTLTRAQAWKYDPTHAGCRMGPKLKTVFVEVRARWLDKVSNIGVANKGHRLRALDRLAAKLEDNGDYLGALRALEQAAREVGGLFEKRASEGGEASVAVVATTSGHGRHIELSREELRLRLHGLLKGGKFPAPSR